MAVAISESCFSSLNRKAIGAEIDVQDKNLSTEAQLFGESPSRIVISFAAENLEKVKEIVANCPFAVIGKIGGEDLKIKFNDNEVITAKIAELENIWETSLEKQLEN